MHGSAIIGLTADKNTWSAETILRTLLEGWIVARWVVEEDTDARAEIYIAKSLNETLKFFKRIQKLAQDNPNDEQHILNSAGLSSLKECDRRISELSSNVTTVKQRYGVKQFPSLAQCARDLDAQVEWTYASLYGFLLSEQVHVGAGAAFRFFQELGPDIETARAARIQRIIITAYFLLLDLLRITSATLGEPSLQSLARFEQLFERIRTSIQFASTPPRSGSQAPSSQARR